MSDDEDNNFKDRNFSTPKSKKKTKSKFENILDDLELKMPKPISIIKKNNINKEQKEPQEKVNNTENNNSSTILKEQKNENIKNTNAMNKKNQKLNNINKNLKKFNSFVGKSKNLTNNSLKNKKNSKDNISSKSTGDLTIGINKGNKSNRKNLTNGIKNFHRRGSSNFDSSQMHKIFTDNNNNTKIIRPSTPGIRNQAKNNDSNKNGSIENKNKESIVDPLYIPHIVKDPLDILKEKIELILERSNEDINKIINGISILDLEMENAYAKEHCIYAKELLNIYNEKEQKQIDINNKYDYELYKMFKDNGTDNNNIYNNMMKEKVEQILNIEKEFNNKKLNLKNNFNSKIEEINKIYELKRKEIENKNISMLNEIKDNIYEIIYDEKRKIELKKNKSKLNVHKNDKNNKSKSIRKKNKK